MESSKKKDLYLKLKKDIDLILSNEELSKNLNDKKFKDSFYLILENFKILEENIKPKKTYIKNFIKKLNSFGFNFKFSKKKLDLENEIIDNVNFIKTFIRNITNKELYDFENEKKSDENLNNKNIEKIEDKNYNKNNSEYNYGNYEDYKNTILNQMVQKRIGEDLIKGNYYFYDSKPKIIPILRYIIGIMIIIASLIFLSELIIGAITIIKIPGDPAGTPPKELSLIAFDPFTITLWILLIMTFIYLGYKHLMPIKNDNFKYKMSNFPLGIATFMGVILMGSDILNLIQIYPNGFLDKIISSGTTANNVNLFLTSSWISLSLSIFLILFSIPLLINFILKPKKNLELTKELTEKYKKEIYEKGIIK